MLEFVIILLPGVLFALGAQRLMRCRLDIHDLLFLTVLNILVLNLAALVLRNFIMDFLSTDSYALATGTLAYSQGLLHQLLCRITLIQSVQSVKIQRFHKLHIYWWDRRYRRHSRNRRRTAGRTLEQG